VGIGILIKTGNYARVILSTTTTTKAFLQKQLHEKIMCLEGVWMYMENSTGNIVF
jgi:spore coat protein CotF